jgi:hypothetical protein
MDTAVELEFGDGTYRFWLPLPQIVALERACGDVSILTIEERLRGAIGQEGEEFVFLGGGSAMIADVRETIRLGLAGGDHGMVEGEEIEVGPIRARQLVDEYAYPARPLAEGVVLAWRILHAAIFGVRLKKKAEPQPEAPSASPSEKAS